MAQPAGETRLKPSLPRVLERVKAAGVMPLDPWHLVALLEMEGWNDATARQLGYEDLFDLAHQLHPQVAREVAHLAAPPFKPRPWYQWVVLGTWHFIRGLVFAMPMLISSWATLYFGISLWSYTRFGVPQATGIGLATVGSFLATSGFTQAMARRGLFYISLKEYRLARRTSNYMVRVGIAFTLLMGLAVALLLTLVPVLKWSTIKITTLYYPFLSLIWLFLGLLYMLQRELVFTAVVAVGIGIAYTLFHSPLLAGLPEETVVLISHAAALSFSALASGLLAWWFFRRLEGRSDAGVTEARPSRWSVAIRQLFPFWLYGVLYFGFLFFDRLMAWSTPSVFHPQAFTFNGPYELGMNWAALGLLLPMGWVEMGINYIVDMLHRLPAVVDARQIDAFNRRMTRIWATIQAAVAIMTIPSVLGVYLLMRWLSDHSVIDVAPLALPVSRWVFFWAATGYGFLAGGLFNILILFATNQPWPVVRVTAMAAATSLVVSFLGSRFWYRCFEPGGCVRPEDMLRYPQAVVGFVAGALVFWWLSARYTRESFRRADYLLYLST